VIALDRQLTGGPPDTARNQKVKGKKRLQVFRPEYSVRYLVITWSVFKPFFFSKKAGRGPAIMIITGLDISCASSDLRSLEVLDAFFFEELFSKGQNV